MRRTDEREGRNRIDVFPRDMYCGKRGRCGLALEKKGGLGSRGRMSSPMTTIGADLPSAGPAIPRA